MSKKPWSRVESFKKLSILQAAIVQTDDCHEYAVGIPSNLPFCFQAIAKLSLYCKDTQVIPSPSSSALNTRSQRTKRLLHKSMECLWNKWHTQHQLVEAAPCKRMQKGSRFFISISKCSCMFYQISLFLFMFIFFVKGRITLQDVASQR